MKEFLQSIFDSTKDRIKNPFIGTYIAAFIIFNWRTFLILLFSDKAVEFKIIDINNNYCTPDAFIWPLLIAFLYIILLPYLNLIFEWVLHYSTEQRKIRKHKQKMFDFKQRRVEVSEEKMLEDIRAGFQDVASLNNQVSQLKKEKDDLLQRIDKDYENARKALTDADQRYKSQIHELEKDLFNAKRHNELKDPSYESAMNILDLWDLDNFENFLKIAEKYIIIQNIPGISEKKHIDKYVRLGICSFNGEFYDLTIVGQIIYDFGQIKLKSA